jgi:tRNA-dependent cyclodipeptide synthase
MFSLKEENFVPVLQEQLNTHKASFKYNDLIDIDLQTLSFAGKKALLFVSVGQEYHEKGKFLATIELLNKYPFASCDIVMADTLQRHNHRGRLGDESWKYSKKAGDQWLVRSEFALNSFNLPHKIIRWDELLNHHDYAALKEQIDKSYNENAVYQEAIHSNVMTYIERLQLLNPITDKETLFKNGLEYLIEECPIVMPLWAQMGYDFIIYPKPLTPGMRMTRDLFVADKYPGKCQWLFLRFKKR